MLTVSQLSKSFAGRALFDDVSLQVNRGDRIGLVGPNGAGKSTLFALLLGDVSPDKGTIAIEKNATIGFLPQETAAAGDETVLELALAVSPELVHAQKVIKAHEAAVAGMADPGADAAYHNALHVFDEHGGWELEPKAKRVLAGLAFRETDFERPARALKWRLDHARSSRALARDATRPPSARRTDEPSGSRIASMVPGISAKLSGRDCHDLARSRIFESASRQHRRDRALETGALPGRLGQLHRAESCARRTTARRLQKSAERNRVAAIVCRSISRQGNQSVASAEQVETDRSDEKNRGPGRARKDDQVPFPATGAQRPARSHA